jgi:hypothetical protein
MDSHGAYVDADTSQSVTDAARAALSPAAAGTASHTASAVTGAGTTARRASYSGSALDPE